jgi:hypothetical protein
MERTGHSMSSVAVSFQWDHALWRLVIGVMRRRLE